MLVVEGRIRIEPVIGRRGRDGIERAWRQFDILEGASHEMQRGIDLQHHRAAR